MLLFKLKLILFIFIFNLIQIKYNWKIYSLRHHTIFQVLHGHLWLSYWTTQIWNTSIFTENSWGQHCHYRFWGALSAEQMFKRRYDIWTDNDPMKIWDRKENSPDRGVLWHMGVTWIKLEIFCSQNGSTTTFSWCNSINPLNITLTI